MIIPMVSHRIKNVAPISSFADSFSFQNCNRHYFVSVTFPETEVKKNQTGKQLN